MTWRDERGDRIDYYARNDDGSIKTDSKGRQVTNVTYDHDPPMVERYNDHGYNETRAQRADDFNDTDKLGPMSRSENSSKSGGVEENGQPRTYRQDQGDNFTWE
jgi:hypothetical protein